MADTLAQQLKNFIESGGKTVKTIDYKTTQELSLYRIGKPARFTKEVDKGGRIAEYIESKMNVIDLIPCDFSIPITKILEVSNQNAKNIMLDAIRPNITYDGAIKDFAKICNNYGLPYIHGGLRLFLTDDTTATDEFTNIYQENLLGSFVNKFTSYTNQIRSFGRSVSSKYEDWVSNVIETAGGAILSGRESLGLGPDQIKNETVQGTMGFIGGTAKAIAKIALQGNRLSLPKAWSDSTYSPNFNAVVKLVSPYGHPEAIKEFIIKPLMFLLIMTGARTTDGVSYGQSPKMTVKAYGNTYLPLATISGVSLRKGGADTAYNIYRQPLTIDVSITFQSLLSGFAIHEATNDPMNTDVFSKADKIDSNLELPRNYGNTFFSTLGSVIESIKPVAINKISRRYAEDSGLPKLAIADDNNLSEHEAWRLAQKQKNQQSYLGQNIPIDTTNAELPPQIPTQIVQSSLEAANRTSGEVLKSQVDMHINKSTDELENAVNRTKQTALKTFEDTIA